MPDAATQAALMDSWRGEWERAGISYELDPTGVISVEVDPRLEPTEVERFWREAQAMHGKVPLSRRN